MELLALSCFSAFLLLERQIWACTMVLLVLVSSAVPAKLINLPACAMMPYIPLGAIPSNSSCVLLMHATSISIYSCPAMRSMLPSHKVEELSVIPGHAQHVAHAPGSSPAGHCWGCCSHHCCQDSTSVLQDWLVPIHAVVDSQWHTPKALGSRSTQTLSLKMSDVQLQPAFGHIPLIHTATQLIKASRAPPVNDQQPIPVAVPPPEAVPLPTPWLSESLTSTPSLAGDLPSHAPLAPAASVASTVAAASAASILAAKAVASHVPFRPSCMHVTAEIESLAVALVDDRYGHPIEVMAVRLQVGSLRFYLN